MNTYSNDLNVHVFETLNVLIFCQEFPPNGGGIFDQVMSATLIRFLFVLVPGSNEQLHLLTQR